MATRQFNLRALAVVIGCASLLPIACSGDDDSGNPTPPGSGGSSGKGGSAGKGGSGAKGGTGGGAGAPEGGATTGGTNSSGGKGGSSSGGKGGSGAKGGSGGKGGTGGTQSEGGASGGPEAGSGGTGGTGPTHDCTDDDKVMYNCGSTAHPAMIECYSDCNPTQTDGSEQFMNRCPNEPWTLGGVTSTCQPWTNTLTKLGSDCTVLGPGCTLPALPMN